MTLATELLTAARRAAISTGRQPDVVLAEDMAVLLEDLMRILPSTSPGFLRWQAQYGVAIGTGKVRPDAITDPSVRDLESKTEGAG
jgi:hypothetical protein